MLSPHRMVHPVIDYIMIPMQKIQDFYMSKPLLLKWCSPTWLTKSHEIPVHPVKSLWIPVNPMSSSFLLSTTTDGHHGTHDGTQVPRASCGYDAWIARAKMKPQWPHCAWPQEPGEQWLPRVLGIKHQTSSWYDLIWFTIINVIYHH